jgi:hypothetical protein
VPVQFGKDRTLGLDRLRHVFLDEARSVERCGKVRRGTHPGGGPGRVVGEPMLGERAQPLPDGGQPGIGDARDGIVERHVPTGAREHHGPGAPDKPGPDHRHFGHCRFSLAAARL